MTRAATPTQRRKTPVSMARIQRLADEIAAKFSPVKVILFGSRARGTARPDSDVDLLIVTDRPARSDTSLKIRMAVDYDFGLDIVVCGRERLAKRVAAGDYFLIEATETGRLLLPCSCASTSSSRRTGGLRPGWPILSGS